MQRAWDAISPHRRALILQVVRYGCVGLSVTSLQAAVYWMLATWGGVHSQIANFTGYLAAVAAGYVLHGRVTFRDAARPENGAAHAKRGAKFVLASLVSLGLNALWVYLCVSWRHWPTWTPIPAMIFITPALVFVLNKQWVFQDARVTN
ncbi:MAG: GtrA family protein [Sphingobium sp.]|nr:GtrA family protein [Sphingobium sp.]MCP5399220.1 GtrA family protein [Sphingomonas sp.]